MHKRRAILFMAWGERHVEAMLTCIRESVLPDYPIFLLTDETTPVASHDQRFSVIRARFSLRWKLRKVELIDYLPANFDSFLYLDVDTRVLDDLSLGFEKAERFGIAMAQAAHYSLDHFHDFRQIMELEQLSPRGQLIYNTGVIFFSTAPSVLEVLRTWQSLAVKHRDRAWSDQPYFTLAMEKLEFNPYTLTTGYNHRAFGELISGVIRVWHTYRELPENLNVLEPVFPRRYEDGKIVAVPL